MSENEKEFSNSNIQSDICVDFVGKDNNLDDLDCVYVCSEFGITQSFKCQLMRCLDIDNEVLRRQINKLRMRIWEDCGVLMCMQAGSLT